MKEEINEYDQQGLDFLEKTGTTFKIYRLGTFEYFPSDAQKRDVYEVTLSKENDSYTFRFGDSIANTYARQGIVAKDMNGTIETYGVRAREARNNWKKPRAYDVLSGLTIYDPGDFENFCSDYGYDNDSIKDEAIYKAVVKEYRNVSRLFSEEELELLAEII